MKTYKFEPRECYLEKGITYRPFHIDGKEIFRLDLSIMLGEDKTAATLEMGLLCEAIKEHTGAIISPGEIPAIIKTRQIEVSDG